MPPTVGATHTIQRPVAPGYTGDRNCHIIYFLLQRLLPSRRHAVELVLKSLIAFERWCPGITCWTVFPSMSCWEVCFACPADGRGFAWAVRSRRRTIEVLRWPHLVSPIAGTTADSNSLPVTAWCWLAELMATGFRAISPPKIQTRPVFSFCSDGPAFAGRAAPRHDLDGGVVVAPRAAQQHRAAPPGG